MLESRENSSGSSPTIPRNFEQKTKHRELNARPLFQGEPSPNPSIPTRQFLGSPLNPISVQIEEKPDEMTSVLANPDSDKGRPVRTTPPSPPSQHREREIEEGERDTSWVVEAFVTLWWVE